jgi:hypothetical protein
MTYDKRLHKLFPSDIAEATAYYDDISIDLGNRFRAGVRLMLTEITDRPESFGFVRKPLRAAMINGFPYLLLFTVEKSVVYVAGLYHASSDPDRWSERKFKNA